MVLYFVPVLPDALRVYSLGLGVVSLLPVKGLDGATALSALLERVMLPDRAAATVRFLSCTVVLLLFFISTAVHLLGEGNPTLLLLSVYLTVTVLSP